MTKSEFEKKIYDFLSELCDSYRKWTIQRAGTTDNLYWNVTIVHSNGIELWVQSVFKGVHSLSVNIEADTVSFELRESDDLITKLRYNVINPLILKWGHPLMALTPDIRLERMKLEEKRNQEKIISAISKIKS